MTRRISQLLSALIILLSVILSSEKSKAQTYGTSSHTITVIVATLTGVTVNVGTVSFNIAGANAVAGQDAMTMTDQTTTISWGINSSLKKITINTSLAAPLFTLSAVALSPTQGTASSQATVSTIAQDFLINLARSSGSATVKYTATALASTGTGTDSHTITFTIATQ